METISNVSGLKQRIAFLEQKRNYEKDEIASEFTELKESLRPANLIKNFIKSIKKSPEVKADLIHGAVGLATGFLTNKMLLSQFHGPWKRIIALLVQAGIVNVAVKYPDTIKSKVISVLTGFLKSIRLKTSDSQPNAGYNDLR